MTLPTIYSQDVSIARNRLALSPGTQLSASRLPASQSKTARMLFASAEKRLYDGTGRTNYESSELVRLGEKLHSQEELDQALIKFTAAIADKDKCKANDLSHAQAYLGAAAIYECQGHIDKAFDHYHIGSRILNTTKLNTSLLAGSYVRIALIYEGKGVVYYPRAIEFLKRALEIYKLNDQNHYVKVRDELRKIYLKLGQPKVAARYTDEAVSDIRLFQKGQNFLHDYLQLHTQAPLTSSRSSVDTEPSPLKEVILPHVSVGSSPIRLVLHQSAGTSPIQQKDASANTLPMIIRHQTVQCSPGRVEHHDANHSPIRFEHKEVSSLNTLPMITRHQTVQRSPARVEHHDANHSPIRFEHKEVSSLIDRLENYEPGFLERGKGKVAKALQNRLGKFSRGEISLEAMQAYIEAHFDIEDNPAFAGRQTHRLKDIFEEARNQLALLKRTN